MTGVRQPCAAVAALAVAALAACALAAPASAGWTGRAIVEVDAPGLMDRVAERNDLEVIGEIPQTGQLVVELEGGGVQALRRELGGDARVEAVVKDRRVELRFVPRDPIFRTADPNAPGGDRAQWNLIRAGAQRAWNLSRGAGARVAVIDTGAYVPHPDLAGRVVSTANCTVSGCLGSDVSDAAGHGTHVAGLACADTNSGYGLASLGFDCGLIVIRSDLFCSAVARGIVLAADRGADAINLSLGGCGAELNSPLSYALSKGAVPIAAGANEPAPSASDNYPAQFVQPEGSGPNINLNRGLTVTAARHDGDRAAFAQRTSGVSVAAYGSATDEVSGGRQGILSSWPPPGFPVPLTFDAAFSDPTGPGPVRTEFGGDDRFAYLVGTSMASPQVAGLVALMRAARPKLAPAKVVRLIKLTASNCGRYRAGLGWGRIRADRAVGAALGRDLEPPASRVLSAKRARRDRRIVTVRLKRFDRNCARGLPRTGVRAVNVQVSVNGRRYRRIAKTAKNRVTFRAKRGRAYRFRSIAIDRARNREPAPANPDAKLRH